MPVYKNGFKIKDIYSKRQGCLMAFLFGNLVFSKKEEEPSTDLPITLINGNLGFRLKSDLKIWTQISVYGLEESTFTEDLKPLGFSLECMNTRLEQGYNQILVNESPAGMVEVSWDGSSRWRNRNIVYLTEVLEKEETPINPNPDIPVQIYDISADEVIPNNMTVINMPYAFPVEGGTIAVMPNLCLKVPNELGVTYYADMYPSVNNDNWDWSITTNPGWFDWIDNKGNIITNVYWGTPSTSESTLVSWTGDGIGDKFIAPYFKLNAAYSPMFPDASAPTLGASGTVMFRPKISIQEYPKGECYLYGRRSISIQYLTDGSTTANDTILMGLAKSIDEIPFGTPENFIFAKCYLTDTGFILSIGEYK